MNKSHPWSPYIIGYCQFPDESDFEFFIQEPIEGKILSYWPTHELARQEVMRLKDVT